ncbi:hypothetical protein JG688_00011536 [Phytophthora aleatoria]|uniref:Uncharacterized protein n=1 Tax=Phytophthora aleatoria TaxID=2496075 RepID=A0A8J5J0E3_9STRA|nr:hypothetical protein JG688_00011536 [Phytophthora aleatoria]
MLEIDATSLSPDSFQQQLQATFVPAGSDTTVDFSPEPITVISEFGRVLDVSPQAYVCKYIGPNASSMLPLDDDEDSNSDFPADILAIGFSRGSPDIVCTAAGSSSPDGMATW